jgi:hypothetical protein
MASLSSVSNVALFRELVTLVATHRACMAEIIEHLAEIDARRAYLELGYPSLFRYCEEQLNFSEDEAGRRIEAARLLRRFPGIVSYLRSGAVSLSVLCALKAHLTPENCDELLAGVSRMSRRKADEWLAAHFPKPDLRAAVRQLPMQRSRSSQSPAPVQQSASVANALETAPIQVATLETPPLTAPRSPPRIEPRSEDRFAIRLTVSREVKEQLELASDLMRHRNVKGDLEPVIAAAVAALLERLKIEKLGGTRSRRVLRETRIEKGTTGGNQVKPREDAKATAEDAKATAEDAKATAEDAKATAEDAKATAEDAKATATPDSVTPGADRSRISNATRRAVVARDGFGCSYVGVDGKRCGSCAFLEFDHREPKALGGTDDASNLRLLCRAHNQREAERVYGADFMQQARTRSAKRPQCAPPCGASRSAPPSGAS